MKHREIMEAYSVLKGLGNAMPLSLAYKLYQVMEYLKPQVQFSAEQEQAVFAKYQPEWLPDGGLKFRSEEEGRAFTTEMQKLRREIAEIDVDISDFRKPTISMNDKLSLSPGEMLALSPLINFVDK